MIEYTKKSQKFILSKSDITKEKNKVLMQALAENIKVSPKEIEDYAKHNLINARSQQFQKDVLENAGDILPFGPVNIEYLNDDDNCEVQISVEYYEKDQIYKLDVEKVAAETNFEFKLPTREDLDHIFNSFIGNYTYKKEIANREVQEGDIVQVNIQSTKDKEVVQNLKSVILQAQKHNTFSINAELIGKNINQKFSVNDPDNTLWTIEIEKIMQEIQVNLASSNDQKEIEMLKELNEQKSDLEANYLKEFSSGLLKKYLMDLVLAVDKLNIIDFSETFLKSELVRSINNQIGPIHLIHGVSTSENLDEDNPQHEEYIQQIALNTRLTLIHEFIYYILWRKYPVEITQELFDNEYRFANDIIPLINPNFKKPTNEEINNVLYKQLLILQLIKIHHPEAFTPLCTSLGFSSIINS
ncbi:hypothetical protein MCAL160_0922 [Mycoplasmopsis californica HAZ160_1]|uniref:Trigger factor n=1 Tax=Mycoplasmopsis californica HAZ160_1 TaxID=1397850 RepID=A0AAT9F8N1_9BACT|nr:hypothetical protein [Mycoplasmopsis californica]BAP01268.1 hypothetical protein MCAL160_0922 [Mycoplasmopsis californica HAZ160_1]BBG41142.1 hypothetical protein MCAL106_0922 [Mycoplasmopsis californica]BBG41735.1 hypothetical protein MCAL106E_0922 [Mycoplasmopsis californica]BBG42329.1 hypothetical protein MCAL106L_0922 [Mycoplasmopsis californica]BBG42904.1 hypothetical protein MCAL160E_0922 [Mycoplasmopsis californica]